MAKAKTSTNNKVETAKQFIKYEIIGLSLITLAILGLAASGWVGRAVDWIFLLVSGNWHWLLEAFLIWLAVFFMVKRQRPKMTARLGGFLTFVLVILTWSHLNLYDDLLRQSKGIAPDMLAHTMAAINTQAQYNFEIPVDAIGQQIPKPSAGGGLIGYIIFMSTHYLFDTAGTIFVLLMGGLVAVILFTKKSLVAMIGQGRDAAANRLASSFDSVKAWPKRLFSKREKPAKADKQKVKKRGKKGGLPDPDAIDQDGEEFAAVAEAALQEEREFTVRSFADQLLAEQIHQGGDDEGEELDLPRFVQAPDSAQIKVQFPLEKAPELKELPKKPLKGVVGLNGSEEPLDMPIDLSQIFLDENYEVPPMALLDLPKNNARNIGVDSVKANARKLEQTFESFGVSVKVVNAQIGPTVTQYEIQPAVGVKVSRIVNLSDDIALALAAKDIRIEAPIPGKAAVGIEVPNSEVAVVTLREVLECQEFTGNDSHLTIALGRDISGQPIVGNLSKMPHLLVAGATGSGKSVCVNGIITSILYKAKPSQVKFIMVDPKMVELNVYNGIPHLMAPVVTDPRRAAYALKKVVAEMEHRYELFSKTGCRNMDGYNAMMVERGEQPLPYIVVIVDELADLMMVAPGDVEDAICRLAQMARAAGIHMIIATQRPSVDVITGVIKANIPSRIAFSVSSQVDSRTILDGAGAEKLLGRGDMLYMPVGASKPVRVQGAFLSDAEVERVVNFVKDQQPAQYSVDLTAPAEDEGGAQRDDDLDDLFYDAVNLVVDAQQASVSLLQRKLKVGYARAARLVDQMEDRGYVGPFEGSKPREVRITRDQWIMMQQAASE